MMMRCGFWFLAILGFSPLHFCRGQIAVTIGQNFTGSTYGVDSDAQPADANGAIGLNHFVEFVNGRFSVYVRGRGVRTKTMTDREFWIAAGIGLAAGLEVTDPRIVFEPNSGRWFAVCIDLPVDPNEPNRYLLAVSVTSDPSGVWNAVAFNVDPDNESFGDFPTLGINPDGIVLGADMFDANENNIGGSLTAIPMAALLGVPLSVTDRKYFGGLGFTYGDILQPVVNLNATAESADVLAVSDIGLDGIPHSTLIGSSLQFGTNSPALSPPKTISVPAFLLTEFPPQPDGTKDLDNGDCRFSATVYRVGDILFGVQSTQVGARGAIQWFKINAINFTLLESGVISDEALDLYYPSIAANRAGTVVIGFNGSSATTFVSSYAVTGDTQSGDLKFGKPQLLKSGSASYHDNGGVGTSRWGDYSATSVDPTDQTRFWTIQLYAAASNVWSTQITELITTPIRLRATRSGTDIVVSWPAAAVDFALQHAQSLSAGNSWTTVIQTPVELNGQRTVTISALTAEGYFRLIRP
jgi:hypothetical protein